MQLASLAGSGSSSPYTQVSTNLTSFTGAFNSDVYNNCSNVIAELLKLTGIDKVSQTYMSELGGFINFLYQAAAQHGPAYCGGTISLPLPEYRNITHIWTSQPVTGALAIDAFTVEYQSNLANNPAQNATFDSGVARTIKHFTGVDLTNLQHLNKLDAVNQAGQQALQEQ
jgi:hypothetical protein